MLFHSQNTKKYTEKLMDNFFECPAKVFLSIEKVLEKISEDQP